MPYHNVSNDISACFEAVVFYNCVIRMTQNVEKGQLITAKAQSV